MGCEDCDLVKDPIVKKLEANGFKAVPEAQYPSGKDALIQYVKEGVATITIVRSNWFNVDHYNFIPGSNSLNLMDVDAAIRCALSPLDPEIYEISDNGTVFYRKCGQQVQVESWAELPSMVIRNKIGNLLFKRAKSEKLL